MGIDAVFGFLPCFEKQLAAEYEMLGLFAVVHEPHLAEGLVYLTPVAVVVIHDGISLGGFHLPAVVKFLAVLVDAGVDVAIEGDEVELVAGLLGNAGFAVLVARTENGQFRVGELA